MANYTCEFSKIMDEDSTKYVQVPNENTAKRTDLKIPEKYHTPLRNLDKYKISCKTTGRDKDTDKDFIAVVTYAREFKSDQTGVVTGDGPKTDFIFCAFKQEGDNNNNVIYIKHDDLTSKNNEDDGTYEVYIRGEDDANGTHTFTINGTITYTFLWL